MATNWYGKTDADGIYRHYPSFLRLFRYEFDALLEESEFKNEYMAKLETLLTAPLMEKMNQYLVESSSSEDAQEKIYFKALSYVSDDAIEFWKELQDTLLKRKAPLVRNELMFLLFRCR
jgi:hypothetical protein